MMQSKGKGPQLTIGETSYQEAEIRGKILQSVIDAVICPENLVYSISFFSSTFNVFWGFPQISE